MKYTIDKNKNGFYIEKHENKTPVYFARIRQGKPQFVMWSSHVRYFKTTKAAQKQLKTLK